MTGKCLVSEGARRGTGILKEEGRLRDQTWLMDRLRTAAGRRYHRLHRNCVKRITENGAQPVAYALHAYAHRHLCATLCSRVSATYCA